MKTVYWRLLIFVFLLIGGLFLTNTDKVFAFCIPDPVSSTCNEDYDCENNLGSIVGNNPAFCDTFDTESCYEIVSDGSQNITFCFAAIGEPTPSPAPCGTLNYVCCPPPNYCQGSLVPQATGGESCLCVEQDSPIPTGLPNPPEDSSYDVCQGDTECQSCFSSGKAWTAVGCIPTNPTELVKWIFPYLLGFGGLATFLLIIFAGIQIMTSAGNPEKLKAGKELITSAIMGLIFIILSLFLLRVIGVDILHMPGLE